MNKNKNNLPITTYPAELLAACGKIQVDPASLLDWALRKDSLVLILASGQKVSFELCGEWRLGAGRQSAVRQTAAQKRRAL